MSEPARRSALQGHYRTGWFGACPEDAPGVVLAECRPRSMVQLNGAPEPGVLAEALGASDVDVTPNRTFDADAVSYAWNGPGQWLAESADRSPSELIEHVENVLRPHGGSTTDLSHARTVLRVSGPAATDLLAKLCPIDVEAMRTGDSAGTLAGPFNVQVVKSGDEQFRLHVLRSFGLAMWEMLRDEAAEFGGGDRSRRVRGADTEPRLRQTRNDSYHGEFGVAKRRTRAGEPVGTGRFRRAGWAEHYRVRPLTDWRRRTRMLRRHEILQRNFSLAGP